ncbi:MAG: putative rane protein [Sporolactobacillus laevolacticus]|jgi:uncharacterized repeat protein (TIGR03943 family)|nr:putative rane protein [Sporolactobacillus laevolacticus]
MEEQRIAFHHYLRGILLGGMALFLFRLAIYGDLKYYLSPKLVIYTRIAIIALALLSLVHLVFPPEHDHDHCDDCSHDHPLPKKGLRSLIFYSLFLLPVLTGFIFPNHTLGSDVAVNRTFKQFDSTASGGAASATRSQTAANKKTSQPIGAQKQPISQKQFNALKNKLLKQDKIVVDDQHYTYILNIIEQNLNAFRGKKLELIGFVYRDKSLSSDEIMTARFDITCCIADASVYGILTKGNVIGLKKDAWVRVSGIIGAAKHAGAQVPVLNQPNIIPIAEPNRPYVYDNGVLLD